MNLESICHKKAIYSILGKNSNKKISLFENKYVDNLYNNLVKETAKAYKLISENKSSDIQFEVINAGIPGYTSFHTLSQFTTKLIDLNPDLIISYQLFTDLWYYNSLRKDVIIGDSFSLYNSGFTFGRMIDKSYFIVLCNVILKKYFSKIPDNEKLPSSLEEKIFNDDVLIYYNRNIDIIASLCQKFEIDLVLCPPISLFKENNTLEEEKKLVVDTVKEVISAGANAFVAGSAVFNDKQSVEENVRILREKIASS